MQFPYDALVYPNEREKEEGSDSAHDDTNHTRKKRRRRKRTNGSSFDESAVPKSNTNDGQHKKRRRRKRSANAVGGDNPREHQLPVTHPTNKHETPETDPTEPSPYAPIRKISKAPPPGLGFVDIEANKKRRKRKKKRGNRPKGGIGSGLFSGVNFFNVKKFYDHSKFYSPKHRETNKPELFVQEVAEFEDERIQEISLTDKNVYNRIVNSPQRGRGKNNVITTLQSINPRQFISARLLQVPWGINSTTSSAVETEDTREKQRCCPPCFYVLVFIALIAAGVAVLVLALQGEFD